MTQMGRGRERKRENAAPPKVRQFGPSVGNVVTGSLFCLPHWLLTSGFSKFHPTEKSQQPVTLSPNFFLYLLRSQGAHPTSLLG